MSHQTSSLPRSVLTKQCISKTFISKCVCFCFPRRNLLSVSAAQVLHLPGHFSALSLLPLVRAMMDPERGPVGHHRGKQKGHYFQETHTVMLVQNDAFGPSIQLLQAPNILFHVTIRFIMFLAAERGQDFILVVFMVVFSISQPSGSPYQGGMVRAKDST